MTVFWILISALIVAADQFAKWLISSQMTLTDSITAIPGLFEIVYVKNFGAAFSMMSGRVSLLSLISVLFCLGVAVYWIVKRPKKPLLCAALAMMFSGALGNAIDRICRGYVVDFIKTTFIDFPVFNIADIAIVLGAVLLVVYVVWFDEETGKRQKRRKE